MDDECVAQTPPDGSEDATGTAFKAWIAIPSHLCPMKGEFHRTGPIHLCDPKGPNLGSGTEEAFVMCI